MHHLTSLIAWKFSANWKNVNWWNFFSSYWPVCKLHLPELVIGFFLLPQPLPFSLWNGPDVQCQYKWHKWPFHNLRNKIANFVRSGYGRLGLRQPRGCRACSTRNYGSWGWWDLWNPLPRNRRRKWYSSDNQSRWLPMWRWLYRHPEWMLYPLTKRQSNG